MNTTEPLSGTPLSFEGKVAMMERALGSAGISILFQDPSLAIRYAENLPDHLKPSLIIGGTDIHLFGEKDGEHLSRLKRGVLESGKPVSAEVEFVTGDGVRIYELKIERIGGRKPQGLLSVITEVTESRHREKVLKSLLRELSHRSKNLLAIIQGIATQTARHTLSLDNFLIKFRGRLQSLSNSQDLITDSSWRGAYLFELAEKQFAPYWPDAGVPMPIYGINAHLTPNAAVHLGLALHELIVNSASHGAISAGATSITLNCKEAELDGKKAIEVAWSERFFFPADHEFEDNSFSRTVLERVVPTSMNGRAQFAIDDDSIGYRLTIPETEYEILKRRS
ncbi:two-component sensor histidine kinase [Rhizobium paranaense]|uniref:histidine kinase n=2 Tax=Rhizobium/Agrobacterium group TaxID=227290 RepID=A0A7W8XNJ1_9HYPH|nr:two-component sensor histidine kinase [Rhizobium paranaense]